MKKVKKIEVLFITGFGPIVGDRAASKQFYADTLGLEFKEEAGGYLHTEQMEGAKTFALWPLEQAAESCFGVKQWPREIPVPQAWLELDVKNLESATRELQNQGYKLLVAARREPWGQVVTRLISPEGLLVGLAYTPAMRKAKMKSTTARHRRRKQ